MTDLAFRHAGQRRRAASFPRQAWLAALFSAFALAGAAGLLVGRAAPGPGGAFEPNLVWLLRFMAAIKGAGVLGAVVLVAWRFTRSVSVSVGLGYVGAVSLIALAPGLIWSLAHIELAAGLFHVGLLLFLVLAWQDQEWRGSVGRR